MIPHLLSYPLPNNLVGFDFSFLNDFTIPFSFLPMTGGVPLSSHCSVTSLRVTI